MVCSEAAHLSQLLLETRPSPWAAQEHRHLRVSLNEVSFAFGFVLLPRTPSRLLFLSLELLLSAAAGLPIPTTTLTDC